MLTLADVIARFPARQAPGPRGSFLLGSLTAIRKDPLHNFLAAQRAYGDVVRFTFGPKIAHLIAAPAGVAHVLAENNKNYGKQTRGFHNLRHVLGNGLLTAEGERWKSHRRIAQPAFHRQRIATFAQTMVKAAEDCVARLSERRGQSVDVCAEMSRLTLRIVGETLFHYDPSETASEVSRALSFLLRMANERTTRVVDIPVSWPTPENRAYRKARAVLDEVVLRIIAGRRQRPHEGEPDLLSMLMESKDAETGKSLSDEELRDEAMTIFLAGHETTAMAMTFALLCLSRHPPALRELRAELNEVLSGRSPTIDDLPRLRFNRMVVQETMRLYPPAWAIARSVEGPDEIDGWFIPKDSLVFIAPYVTHRHPRCWENPEGFDPRRFEQEPVRWSYFPFGGGPRACIGNGFAMMEAELLLATLAQQLTFELVPGARVELEPSITLRPLDGLWMTIR